MDISGEGGGNDGNNKEVELMYWISLNDYDRVCACVQRHRDWNWAHLYDHKCTVLHFACIQHYWRIARALVELGANVNVVNCRKETPLMIVAQRNQLAVAMYFLSRAADVTARDLSQRTPFLWAVQFGHVDMAMLLKKHGANMHAVTDAQQSALMLACMGRHQGMVEYLLRSGAACDARDAHGRTVMHYAAVHGTPEIVQLLVTMGHCAVEVKDRRQATPLMFAVKQCRGDMVDCLLSLGAKAQKTCAELPSPCAVNDFVFHCFMTFHTEECVATATGTHSNNNNTTSKRNGGGGGCGRCN